MCPHMMLSLMIKKSKKNGLGVIRQILSSSSGEELRPKPVVSAASQVLSPL